MIYDVVIAGGGTSGCAAAYIAGKLGLKVLLLEKNIHLGGTISSGLVVPIMKSGENQINTEFYDDLILNMKKYGAQINFQNNSGWLNPEILKIVLDEMMQNVNVDVRFNSSIIKIDNNNQHLQTVYINSEILSLYNYTIHSDKKSKNINELLSIPIETRYVIDATGNCEIGKLLNCKFLNKENEIQPMSLRFIMGGIDLEKFSKWLADVDSDRNVTPIEKIDGKIHLSTAYTWDSDKKWALAPIFQQGIEKNILKPNDINYFQVFTVAGMNDSLAFNCPRVVGAYNPNDAKDVSTVLKEARQSIFRLSNFCKKYFKGFENAYISNIADMLGVRVSNRILGKHIYKIDDFGKNFDNKVLVSNYPIDVHSSKKDCSKLQKMQEYQLPIESLMSADFDNLFVIGRCLSADFEAQAALRVQASCFSMGEGVARYIHKSLQKTN